MTSFSEALESLLATDPPCHGYSRCCGCVRCSDRHLRYTTYILEGTDGASAATRSYEDSSEYFKTPWRFDGQSPPRKLNAGD